MHNRLAPYLTTLAVYCTGEAGQDVRSFPLATSSVILKGRPAKQTIYNGKNDSNEPKRDGASCRGPNPLCAGMLSGPG